MNKDLLPPGVEKYWASNVWDRTVFDNSALGWKFESQMIHLKKSLERYKPSELLILCSGVGVEASIAEKMDFVKKIVAIDINKASCDIAKRRVTSGKVKIVNDDVCDIDYNGQFDAVVCIDALPHLRKQKLLLGKIYKALKPKGHFIGNYFGREHFIPCMIEKHGLVRYHLINSKHRIANFLHRVGLLPRKLVENGWIKAFLLTQKEVKQHLGSNAFNVLEIVSDDWHFFVSRKE